MMYLKKGIMCTAVLAILLLLASTGMADTVYNSRATWESNVAGITTIDFNALAGNSYQTLTVGPVTFDVPGYADSGDLWVSCSGCYAPAIDVALVGNHWMTSVRASLDPGTQAIGVDVANLAVNDTIDITTVDNFGNTKIYPIIYTYPDAFFFGVIASGTIKSITFAPTTSNWIGIDNFSYGTSGQTPVPEPTSLLLLGSGLGMAGLAAWRKRK